jgi:CRP-like cAMP-binding protein
MVTAARSAFSSAFSSSTVALLPKPVWFERKQTIPCITKAYWLIQEGFVRAVTWDLEGSVTTLGMWGAGDMISYEFSEISPYQIECLSPVKALRTPVPENLAQVILSHYRCTETLLAITHTNPIAIRLLKLLQWLGDRFGNLTGDGTRKITLRMTHQHLAEVLGTTRVTVTRLLGLLQKENLVKQLPKCQFLLTQDFVAIAQSSIADFYRVV